MTNRSEAVLTSKQHEYLTIYNQHGESYAEAARVIGCSTQNVHATIKAAKLKLARSGIEQGIEEHVPLGYTLKGTSTLIDKDGNTKLQWVKTNQDAEAQMEAMKAVVEAMKEDIPRAPACDYIDVDQSNDLCNMYVITDYHLGALCWGEETGADWDTEIAEEILINWFESAIARAPDCATGIFAQLGDFLHWDGIEGVTPTSGHVLDADTRYQKLIRVAIRVVRQVIDMLLYKHEVVHVVMAEGNHDIAGSMWLSELFAELYADEPRVHVDTRPDPYYCFEFGKTSLFFHHGHKKKMTNITDVFVAKFREVFGRTKHSYGHMGHLHHNVTIENNLMTMEQHRTLAAPDAHASRGGWMSGRDSKVITYHREYGEVSRLTVNYDMLK
jgi:predicted DNA-binding protein YlxM (UPF0122 family)